MTISLPGCTARVGLSILASCVVAFPTTASAGRLIATGHDADHHCGRDAGVSEAREQCHFFRVAVDYVRGGAPDPSKPVLVLDRGPEDVVASLDRVYGAALPRVVLDPRSAAFATSPISTDHYSAVVIASSKGDPHDPSPQDLNEIASAPDSDAINARAGALRAFFDDGGGIFVNSGSTHGDEPNDPYYDFLPVTVRGAIAVSPFVLTAGGRGLGFFEHDVACCPTHNTFEPPSDGSALRAIDVDRAGRVVSVFAETERFAALAEPPFSAAAAAQVAKRMPEVRRCVPRSTITLRLSRVKGVRFDRAIVYRDGKFLKRLRGARITQPIKVKVLRGSARMKIRIVVFTTGKRKLTIRRTYKRCV